MGLFSNLFSKPPDYPAIDPQSEAARRIAEVEDQLDQLAGQVKDPLEIVPSEHAAYVFLGKPPKNFGLAWIHDGKVSGLNALVKDQGIKPLEVQKVVEQLRQAYEHAQDVDRYTTTVHGRTVVVTPSRQLEAKVHEILDKFTH